MKSSPTQSRPPRLGQNFLLDTNFLKYIVKTANISPDDDVLEIGSGPGVLTKLLADVSRSVTAVEIDPKLYALAQAHLAPPGFARARSGDPMLSSEATSPARATAGGAGKVRLIRADILDHSKTRLNPEVLKYLPACRQARPAKSPVRVVSNLPYKMAVPIIMALLEANLAGHLALSGLQVMMVQWEVAQRLTARPGSTQYSGISVLLRYLASVNILRKVPPDVFRPKPKVHSALISITPDNNANPRLYAHLKKLVPLVFHYRRKTIRNALGKMGIYSRPDIEKLLSSAQVKGESRPQDIPLSGYIKMAQLLYEAT